MTTTSKREAARSALASVMHHSLHEPILAALCAAGLIEKSPGNGGAVHAASHTAPDARKSSRIAKLDAAIDAESPEMKNLHQELKRLGIGWTRDAGVDLVQLRQVTTNYGWSSEQKMRLIQACANVGLTD